MGLCPLFFAGCASGRIRLNLAAMDSSSSTTPRRGWPADVGVAVAYLFVALTVTWPLVLGMGSTLLGRDGAVGLIPSGDQNCFMWTFWWFRQALFDGELALFHTPLMAHPGGLSLLTTPITPLYAVMSLPFQVFCSLITLYNGFFLFSLWSTAWFTYLMSRAMGALRPVAFVCGCLYGYMPFHFAHVGHLNLTCSQWAPMALWAVWRGLETRRVRWAVLAGLAVAAQAYTSWYLLVFLGFLLCGVALARGVGALRGPRAEQEKRARRWAWGAVFFLMIATNVLIQSAVVLLALVGLYGVIVLAMLIHTHPHRGAHLRNMVVFLVVAGALVAPFHWMLLQDARAEKTVDNDAIAGKLLMSAEPVSYLLPPSLIRAIEERWITHSSPVYEAPYSGEFMVFPGYVTWALIGFAFWRLRKKTRGWFWLVIAGVFVVLSMGMGARFFGEPIPFFLRFDYFVMPGVAFHVMPLFGGLRVFARFGVIVELALVAWLAMNLDGALWREKSRVAWKQWGIVLAIAAVALVERFHGPQSVSRVREAGEYRRIPALVSPDSVVLGLPLEQAPAMMYCQTRHGLRLVNYFGARVPASTREQFEGTTLYGFFATRLDPGKTPVEPSEASARVANQDLDRLGVDVILVHRALCDGAKDAWFQQLGTELLGWRETARCEEFILFSRPLRDSASSADLPD